VRVTRDPVRRGRRGGGFVICSLRYKDWWHEQWLPNRLTWLFFHDEAVAFAAGHRPCALCRRPSHNAYRDIFSGAGILARFIEMDRQLHQERIDPKTRQRRLHSVQWSELPDGTFVMDRGHPGARPRAPPGRLD
jgi:hypothetical protein